MHSDLSTVFLHCEKCLLFSYETNQQQSFLCLVMDINIFPHSGSNRIYVTIEAGRPPSKMIYTMI